MTDHTYGLPPNESVLEHIGNCHQAILMALAALNGGQPALMRPLLDMASRRLARMHFQIKGVPFKSAALSAAETFHPKPAA